MSATKAMIPVGKIEQRIFLIRGNKVIIDTDLAEFYGVSTKQLNQQVKRNRNRFPKDFVFRLTAEEKAEVVTNCDHLSNLKYSRALPHAFTEHGAIMAATVVNSARAIEVSVFIVRAFVRLRRFIAEHKELAQKIAHLERGLANHDETIVSMINAIEQLTNPELPPPKRRIGFQSGES